MKKMSQQQYQDGFVALITIGIAALALAAVGGNFGTVATWMVGLILGAFVLSQGVYYAKNHTFFSYEVS